MMNTKFIIVGAPRTGSTLLVKTLNSINGILCHGELLQDKVRGFEDGFEPINSTQTQRDERMQRLVAQRTDDPVGFVQRALDSLPQACGMKVLYAAFLNPVWAPVLEYINSLDNLHYIHIKRSNTLRRYISESIMRAGGPIHSGIGGRSERATSVHVDIDAFLKSQGVVGEQDARVISSMADKPVLDVFYEQLSSDPKGTIAGVCRYIGLDIDASVIKPALQKVGASELRDVVSNYDELIAHEGTRELLLRD
jgi:LPS sulfotransferase NodH